VSGKLVVFDFDHTLYDGDSGSHLVGWLLRRNAWRTIVAILAAPLLLPLVAFLPTRRFGISGFLWIGTLGTHARHDLDGLIDQYVTDDAANIRARKSAAAAGELRRQPTCTYSFSKWHEQAAAVSVGLSPDPLSRSK